MLDLEKFDLGDIAMALQDQTDYDYFHLVDPRTGEMGLWTRDGGIDGRNPLDLDDVDLTVIEPLPSSVWYQDMADFAAGLSDERAGERLSRALSGKGAFRRFKNELHDRYPHLVPVWNAFSDNRAKLRAVEWLADNTLIDEGSADRFAAEHPDPGLP
ncbi:hypothetical protein DMH01_06900 [Amycolatopsis sp. WAC 04182]|uniref:UPF0158 family protein n=1 Tax=Amycolatopsis sp. WAC 04182 TaxID=2203198 RepID=UPI000F797B6B|nr:UPF0158 family protein [Amycolatopsis sp. WAC 04182]RSN66050.1 hypothetical protein DMH01_06900 [Amycolatopsis sp. WAC 04182]